MGKETAMGNFIERLSEAIGGLFNGLDIVEMNSALFDMLAQEMVTDCNMLAASMIVLTLAHSDGALIISVDRSW